MRNELSLRSQVAHIRAMYSDGTASRAQAIGALVALGFAPAASAAVVDNNEQLRKTLGSPDVTTDSNREQTARRRLLNSQAAIRDFLGPSPAGELAEHVAKIDIFLRERLARFPSDRYLFTYDGSIYDQLAYKIVTESLPRECVTVICHTRPCMANELFDEVVLFSETHGYQLLRGKSDCKIDYRTLSVMSHACYGVLDHVSAYFDRESGVYVSAIGVNQSNAADTEDAAERYDNCHIEINEDNGDVTWITNNGFTQWRNVLLLHGLMPYELLACHLQLIGTPIYEYHVPLCFFPYYYEIEKLYVRTLIRTSLDTIRKDLMSEKRPV